MRASAVGNCGTSGQGRGGQHEEARLPSTGPPTTEEVTMSSVPLTPQNPDANPDDAQKWDQVLKGEDYDLDADGSVDDDVEQHGDDAQGDDDAPAQAPSPDQV
jgi:hypothetical protein